MPFVAKSVHKAGSIGEDLRDLRVRAGWGISQLANTLKFTETFLRALEEECWEEIPDPAYAERMLKAEVEFLGGNVSYFLDKYRECLRDRQLEHRPEDRLPRPSRVRFLELSVGSRWIALGAFILFLIAIGLYVLIQIASMSSAPPLTVELPKDGQTLETPRVIVRGRTQAEAALTVNGENVVVQKDGTFSFEMDVSRGVSPITIVARRRYGKETAITRRVVYERALPEESMRATEAGATQK